jgi:tRNA nucleotidyltransferase (CCA-adding enzyme)
MKLIDFINFYEDSKRRDLTFNAMSMDWDGTVYDYFDGISDLSNGLVRFVGDADKRMEEDYLRILRFFRFLGRMPKPQVDLTTMAKIGNNCAGLVNISGERIWSEMKKIMAGEHVDFILDLMIKTGVMESIEAKMVTVTVPASKDPVTNLAAFADEQYVDKIIERWKLAKTEQSMFKWLVTNRNTNPTMQDMKAMLVNSVDRSYVMELMKIQKRKEDFEAIKTWEIPIFPVTGGDLIKQGFKQGPDLGNQLKAMKQRWIDSDYTLEKEQLI